MAGPNWPGTLPQTLEEASYSEGLADELLRSKVDVGPAKVRRRFTAGVERLKGTITVDATGWATLRTFFYSNLAAGALPMTYTHPSTGASVQARFVTPPTITPRSPYMVATLDLEILP